MLQNHKELNGDTMENMKNLIIIHLESLSNILYFKNKMLFNHINKISNICINYNNFYASSTSTIMNIADLFFGDMRQYESSSSINSLSNSNIVCESLFTVMDRAGYSTKTILYPPWNKEDLNNLEYITGTASYTKTYEEFKNLISGSIINDNPFALYIYNGLSGISFLNQDKTKDWSDCWDEGYVSCDDTVGYIFKLLNDKKLMDHTVVIMFGDHGDDFWTHSFNSGFCHCIEPYASMIHTPLFVYSPDIPTAYVNDIVSTSDIRNLVLSMLPIEYDNCCENYIYDRYRSSRKYSLSRNLFVNQEDCSALLKKSYSLSNGYYNLLVSKDGLEFYFEPCDMTNHCNLLCFYNMNKQGTLSFKEDFIKMPSNHFNKAMDCRRKKEIELVFYEMRRQLIAEVVRMYKTVSNKELSWQKELNFNEINYSDFTH